MEIVSGDMCQALNSERVIKQAETTWLKPLTPYILYSNLYLHFLRSHCENIFKIVCIVSEKIGK